MLEIDGISRVHLLLVSVDDRLYAVDTASSNGTRKAGDDMDFHVAPLENGNVLTLARGDIRLRWSVP